MRSSGLTDFSFGTKGLTTSFKAVKDRLNFDPQFNSESTVIEPPRDFVIRSQIIRPIPCVDTFSSLLCSFVVLKYGLNKFA